MIAARVRKIASRYRDRLWLFQSCSATGVSCRRSRISTLGKLECNRICIVMRTAGTGYAKVIQTHVGLSEARMSVLTWRLLFADCPLFTRNAHCEFAHRILNLPSIGATVT